MIMKIEYQDRIEDYLLNRMSNDDRTLFEQDLKMDTELREQYEFISMVKTALMFENIEKDVLSVDSGGEDIAAATTSGNEKSDCNYEKNIRIDIRKKHTQSRFSKSHVIIWISGIAAMLIVGLFIFNNLPSYHDPALLETAYIQPSDSILSPAINKGEMCSEGRNEMEIETLLAMGDYSKALVQAEQSEAIIMELMRTNRESNSRGNCQEILGDENESLKCESSQLQYGSRGDSQEETGDELDSLENMLSQLQYWKAKALIGLNRKAEAIKLLDEIRHSESKYKEQADSLYKVLR